MEEIYALYVAANDRRRERLLSLVQTAASVETINQHAQAMSRVDFEQYWSVINDNNRARHLSDWRGEPQPPSALAEFMIKSLTNNESHQR